MDTTTFINLLSIIGILFLIMVTGYICRRIGLINADASKHLSRLIICLCQPMMIVGALVSKEFSTESLKRGLFFLLIGLLLHPLMAAFAFPFGRIFKDLNERKVSIFALIFTNCGFIGLPILETVFPGDGAFCGAFFLIGFHLYIWTLGIAILSIGRPDIRLTPKKALLNYGTVPCLIGFLLYLLKAVLPVPAIVPNFCNYLGNLCMPVSVLITGSLLATQPLLKMFKNPRLYLFNFFKLLLLPVLVAFVAKLCTLGMADNTRIILFCTVIAALPSASTITMLSDMYDIDPGYAAQTVGSSSLLSLATLPLLYFLGDFIAKL